MINSRDQILVKYLFAMMMHRHRFLPLNFKILFMFTFSFLHCRPMVIFLRIQKWYRNRFFFNSDFFFFLLSGKYD